MQAHGCTSVHTCICILTGLNCLERGCGERIIVRKNVCFLAGDGEGVTRELFCINKHGA